MTTSGDPSLPSDEPLRGTFHNVTPVDPSRQHQCSLTGGAHTYDYSPIPWPERDRVTARFANRQVPSYEREPLEPRYTAKLNRTSPHFPTVAEAARRRRNRWSAWTARGGIALMIVAPLGALKWGTGIFPAGAFVAGLIIFVAACFISGSRNRRAP